MALTCLSIVCKLLSDRYPQLNLPGFRFPSFSGTRGALSCVFFTLFARLIPTVKRQQQQRRQRQRQQHNAVRARKRKQKRSMAPEWSCHRRFLFQSINRKQRDTQERGAFFLPRSTALLPLICSRNPFSRSPARVRTRTRTPQCLSHDRNLTTLTKQSTARVIPLHTHTHGRAGGRFDREDLSTARES